MEGRYDKEAIDKWRTEGSEDTYEPIPMMS